MELNIVDINLPGLNAQFGISDQRTEYLMAELDKIVETYMNDEVSKAQLFQHIASICNTVEELIICIHAHDSWYNAFFNNQDYEDKNIRP